MLVAGATLAVAFVSSAYTGGISQLLEEFQISSEVATLGVSLFVLGCKQMCHELSVLISVDVLSSCSRSPNLGATQRALRPTISLHHHLWCTERI